MHDFDILFFRPFKTRLSKKEKNTLQAILQEIYKGAPAQYKTLADFELCKEQLVALLDYIAALHPSKLSLFVRYRKTVDELANTNAILDIEITLKAAKKSIESCLLAIIKNHIQIDETALANLVVERCYSGAFSNIEYALGYFQVDNLAFYIENAKSQLLLQFSQQFLLENNLVENGANDLQYANALYNNYAPFYRLQLKKNSLKNTFPPKIQQAFARYIKTVYTVSSFLQIAITLFPMPPQINISNEEGFKQLTDFFQIFEKDGARREKYLCLYREEEDADGNITLVPKDEFSLYHAGLLASYLEQKEYLKGLYYTVDAHTFLYNGEVLLGVNQDGTYRTLSDEELLSPQMTDIVDSLFLWSQFTAETLLKLYQESHSLAEKERYFTTLLAKPVLPEPILKTLLAISKESPAELSKVANYVFTHAYYELTEDELKLLARAATEAKNNTCIIDLIRRDKALYIKCLLLEDPDLKAISQKLPSYAAMYGAINVLTILGLLKVSLSEFDENDLSPACYAVSNGRAEVLATLHHLGVELVQGNSKGRTPAHIAAEYGELAILEKFHELHILLDIKDNNGATPAHYAAGYGRIDILEKLYAFGVPLDVKDNDGNTPAHWAKSSGANISLYKLKELGIYIPLDIKWKILSVTSWFFQSPPRNPEGREEPQDGFCIIS